MRKAALIALAVLGVSGAAYAQNQQPTTGPTNGTPGTSYSGQGSSALPPSTNSTANPSSMDAGTTSAGLAAAQSKLEQAGFSNVKNLSRSTNGIWMGRATKNGVEVAVSLDAAGNVMTQ